MCMSPALRIPIQHPLCLLGVRERNALPRDDITDAEGNTGVVREVIYTDNFKRANLL